MKRIILSVLAIAMAIGITTGAAFALFSSTATVSGVTFFTGNADLKVWNKTSSAWTTDFSPSDFTFSNMYPTYTTFQTFSLKNASTSNISFTLNAKLRNGITQPPAGAWNVLKDVVRVRFTDSSGTIVKKDWETLASWNSTGFDFDTALAQNENRWYRIEVAVDDVGNEISSQSISAINFDFLGTQE